MRRGLQALINSRRGAPSASPPIHTGFVGNEYSDATHQLFLQNRSRLNVLGETHAEEWNKHELLFNNWVAFYSVREHEDTDGMTSPQMEVWYREQATWWSTRITTWANESQPHQQKNSGVGAVVGIGLVLLIGAAVYGASK